MNRVLTVILLFCGLFGSAIEVIASDQDLIQELPAKTFDGRFNTQCLPCGNDLSREFCEVSFYRILATPEKYHGRLIGVVGYLVEEYSRPILYVSRNSSEAEARYEGVALVNANLPDSIKKKINQGIWPVLVVGVFDAKYTGPQVNRLGALRDIQTVHLIEPDK